MATLPPTMPVSRRGDPPWEIAKIFPEQGYWDEYDFFSLPNTRGVEFNDGMIEVLPLPKKTHELLVLFLAKLIEAYVIAKNLGGVVLPSGYKIRIPSRKYRQPDVTYLNADQNSRSNENFTDSAELAVEIVSADDPDRDYVVKREEYALARVPEYWIVDYLHAQILILRLENGSYVEHGKFTAGQQATSSRFPGLVFSVDDLLKIGR
ncbi:MAG TPA: Uma2 family endonuclease [Tepidisphaeraceae bacterium]|jgi:Uma2 family endonuclease|nr:Uma2 family endonuclease [Tepidisphaeraceae bacterium]